MPPKTKKAELEVKFNKLAAQVVKETGFYSRDDLVTNHPAYQQIIGLGERALPLIFRQMEADTGPHWFEALKAITGANPVPRELRGKIREMEKVWLEWARTQGYRW